MLKRQQASSRSSPEPQLPPPKKIERALILDAIREPGNLGAILRTAVGAGVDIVMLAPECADSFNPKGGTSGGRRAFPHPTSPLRAGRKSPPPVASSGFTWLIRPLAQITPRSIGRALPWALIVSNEAHGPSAAARRLATERTCASLWRTRPTR